MEAASSSDDDSSSSESGPLTMGSERRASLHPADDSGSDEDDSDSDSQSLPRQKSSFRQSISTDEDPHSSDDEKESSLSLAERLARQEEQQLQASSHLTERRQRQSKALKIASQRLAASKEASKTFKSTKKSKHAPTEVSSKRKDFFQRQKQAPQETFLNGLGVDVGAHRYKPRDPRMSSLQGHFNAGHFDHHYAFLQDLRTQEIDTLKKRIAAWKTKGKKGQKKRRDLNLTQSQSSLEQDQAELKRLMQEKAAVEREQVDRAAKQAVKKKLQQEVTDGKRGVYFPKRREMKRMHLEARFEELRKRGGDKAVDKAVAKRRKKNKSKDSGLLGGGWKQN